MEPYSDNPSTPEARRATRQREIQDMEAAAAGGDRHRSYVARRFLEEDADDLENEGLDLIDEKRPVTNSAASVASGSSSIFQRREQFQVDQSVNLMDASAATYDTKKKRYGGGLMDSSMVDIFMGEEDPAHRRGGDRSHRTPRDVFCSTRFLIFITCVIVGIMLVVFSAGGYSKGIGIGGNSEKDSQADQSKETPVPIAPNGFHVDRKKLLMNKISKYTSEEELEDESTHAHSALHWLTEDDEARLQFDDPGLSQRYALAVLYFSTQPSTQPNAAFNEWVKEDNWMTKEDVCTWYGVDCEKLFGYNSVVHLNMTANRLGGTLPSKLFLCFFGSFDAVEGEDLTTCVPFYLTIQPHLPYRRNQGIA